MSVSPTNITSKRPVIAVFIRTSHRRKLSENNNTFKTSDKYIRYIQLAKANEEAQTTLYFFADKDVDLKEEKIIGTYFNEKRGIWEKGEFPFPDVLYDRRPGGSYRSKLIREYMDRKGIKKLNAQYYFDKWGVYQELVKNKKVRPHLPLTTIFTKPNDLKEMFKKSSTVYLKALRGFGGLQIIRVIKRTRGDYKYSYFRKRKLHVYQVTTFNKLVKVIESFFQGKVFVIQQAIHLPKIKNSIVDLRGEIQRNGVSQIEIVAILVRMGRKGSPVTTKGTVYLFDDYFQKNLNYSSKEVAQLRRRLENFLLTVHLSLEKSYGKFGEIAIDFALDKQGNIWFIECNARSAKVSLFKTSKEEVIRKAFLNPLEYAKYLCNYN